MKSMAMNSYNLGNLPKERKMLFGALLHEE